MGKSEKPRTPTNTGYPYAPVKVSNQQLSKSKWQGESDHAMGMYAMGNPVFSPRDQVGSNDMKHLEFLRAISQYYYGKVSQAYASGRQLLPNACQASLRNIEGRVNSFSSPILERSEQALVTLDRKVDSVYGLWAASKSDSGATSARQARFDESLQFLREHGLAGLAKHAMSLVMSRDMATDSSSMEPQALRDSPDQQETWSHFAMAPVSKVLESAEPSIRYTQQVYGDAHRAIISSDTYTSAVDAANEVLQRVQESSVYKASAKRLYPAISGIADPALEKLLNSAYAKALIDHLKPLPRQPGEQMLRPMCATC